MSSTIEIDGYTIIEQIGRGGMGRVYKAVQHSVNRTVAIKTLEPSSFTDDDAIYRMLREARISGRLQHPNIVKVYDAGESHGVHFICMEYLGGGDLAAKVNRNLSNLQAVDYCTAVADALGSAHQEGFIHRDIKPENLMLRGDGSVVVTDFGIARLIDSQTRLTVAGAVIGTPQFMSPEQITGGALDGRSDLYSLASVLFMMLTGETPFVGDSAIALSYQHVNQSIPQLQKPFDRIQWFFDKALAKDPNQRFQSGAEMVAGLQKVSKQLKNLPEEKARLIRGETLNNTKPVQLDHHNRQGRKYVVGSLACVLIVSLAIGWWQLSSDPLKTNAGAESTTAIEMTEAQEQLRDAPKKQPVTDASMPQGQADVSSSGEQQAAFGSTVDPLHSRVQQLLATIGILLDAPLSQLNVQDIAANIRAIETLDPQNTEVSVFREKILSTLDSEITRNVENNQFSSAKEQLELFALIAPIFQVEYRREQISNAQAEFDRRQAEEQRNAERRRAEEQKNARLRQLVGKTEVAESLQNAADFQSLRKNYTEILNLEKQNPIGLARRQTYLLELSDKINEALSQQQADHAEAWLELLTAEPEAKELVGQYQNKINALVTLQQQKAAEEEQRRTQIANLQEKVQQHLLASVMTEDHIRSARKLFSDLQRLDSTAVSREEMNNQLGLAYRQLAQQLLLEEELDAAQKAIGNAIALVPSDTSVQQLQKEIAEKQRSKRRNITSF